MHNSLHPYISYLPISSSNFVYNNLLEERARFTKTALISLYRVNPQWAYQSFLVTLLGLRIAKILSKIQLTRDISTQIVHIHWISKFGFFKSWKSASSSSRPFSNYLPIVKLTPIPQSSSFKTNSNSQNVFRLPHFEKRTLLELRSYHIHSSNTYWEFSSCRESAKISYSSLKSKSSTPVPWHTTVQQRRIADGFTLFSLPLYGLSTPSSIWI